MPTRSSARTRSDRLARNDDAILDAAVRIASTTGWSEFTASAVARISGLSKRPVLERHPTRTDLANAVWMERCGPALLDATTRLLEASDVDARVAALMAFAKPSPSLKAAAELLTVAQFDAECRDLIDRSVADRLRNAIVATDLTLEQSAVQAYLVSLGLGLLWIARTLGQTPELAPGLAQVLDVVARPTQPVALPDVAAEHLHLEVFETGDAIRDALLTATLETVSEVGFESATTSRIAKQANVSEGALFARFPTKLAMFVEATDLHAHISLAANERYQQRIATAYGRGVAEAMLLREFMNPEHRQMQRLNLEQLRVGWHDVVLRRLVKDRIDDFVENGWDPSADIPKSRRSALAHVSLGVGTGVVVTSLLVPEAVDLPYSVVTIPLED